MALVLHHCQHQSPILERCSPSTWGFSAAATGQNQHRNQQEVCCPCRHRYHTLITLHHTPSLHLFLCPKLAHAVNATFVNEQSWFSHKTINGARSSLDINNTLKFKHVISNRILQGELIIWGKLSCRLLGGFKCHLWKRRVGGRVTGDDQSERGSNWKLQIWKCISSHKQLRIKPKHSYSQKHAASQGAIKAWCYYFQGMPLKLCLQT